MAGVATPFRIDKWMDVRDLVEDMAFIVCYRGCTCDHRTPGLYKCYYFHLRRPYPLGECLIVSEVRGPINADGLTKKTNLNS